MDLSLSLKLRSGRRGGGPGPSYDPDAEALFARFTTPPTDERKGIINTLIVELKTAGVWQLRDWYHFIGADAQATHQNWKSSEYNITPINSPTFVADRYYQGDGSSAYLNTGASANALAHYQQDSANFSVWAGPGPASNTNWMFGQQDDGSMSRLRSLTASNNLDGRINVATGANSVAVASADGYMSLDRPTSTGIVFFKNGSQIHQATSTATPLDSRPFLYLRDITYCALPWLAGAGGGSLTLQQHTDEYNAIRDYLTAIGAA